MRIVIGAFVAWLCLLHVHHASAHFLFIRIGEQAEAGRAAEVYFSERATAGDPRFVEKVAHTELWMQSTPGEFVPLKTRKATDRLRAPLPAAGAVSVIGICEYGVLKREVPFLLRYYPKAIAGDPGELKNFKPRDKTPLEIMPVVAGDEITFIALHRGKPVPNAVFTTVDEHLINEELKADGTGRVSWKPGESGQYCVYMRVVTKEPGEHEGTKYAEVREFATLAFQWPLIRTDADPEAVALFEKAIAGRAAWKDFPGFTAAVAGTFDGRRFTGTARVAADGTADLELDEKLAAEWVEDQLHSIVLHRKAPASPRQTKPVLRFADNDDKHPLGRLLVFSGGQFASTYRIKGDQINVVNRHIGPENMTITILDNEKNADGAWLPHSYTVQYWDAASGNLLRTDTVQNRWQRVGGFDLPVENTVTTAGSTGLTVRSLTLKKHELLSKK